jgi:hypothetical protein
MSLPFETSHGLSSFVVSPGAWIMHKGLTFTKRKNLTKRYKDLYEVWYVSTQLGDFSTDAVDELSFLKKQHPKWFKTFSKNLKEWLNNASPIDWNYLESQDLQGKLTRMNFKQIIETLL